MFVWFSRHRSPWQSITNQKWKRGNSSSLFPLSLFLALGSKEEADCVFLCSCGLQPLRAAPRRRSPPQKGKPASERHGLALSARPRRAGGPAGGGGAYPVTSGRPRRWGPSPARPFVPPARHGGAGTGRGGEVGAASESRDGRGVLCGENLHRAEVHGAQRGCRLLLLLLPAHDRWVPAPRGPALPALSRSPGSVPPAPLSLLLSLGCPCLPGFAAGARCQRRVGAWSGTAGWAGRGVRAHGSVRASGSKTASLQLLSLCFSCAEAIVLCCAGARGSSWRPGCGTPLCLQGKLPLLQRALGFQ